jgi:Zn finger protein HypA/HybF involved in hydrogenase expression
MALSEEVIATALRAVDQDAGRMRAICVHVGALSAVNMRSFEFCMGACLTEMGMADVRVELTWVPARFECRCGLSYEAEDMFSPCPECGGFMRTVTGGRDVFIDHLEVEDAEG